MANRLNAIMKQHDELMKIAPRMRYFVARVPDMERIYAESKGCCAICGIRPENRLAIDHCHTTGTVRGLLCLNCNTALGKFKDNIDLLRKAIAYLKRSRQLDAA